MSARSKIEWTHATWNPVLGCSKVSDGCKNCYAILVAHRLEQNSVAGYPGLTRVTGNAPPNWTGEIHPLPDRLTEPLRWAKPKLIFVNSMSDLFHPDVPFAFIRRVFGVMQLARWLTFQILTKRAARLAELAPLLVWPDNVWMGVSVENQANASRVDALRRVPARVRWVSAEPLLEQVQLNLDGIQWVVTGGESGPRYRPFDPAWAIDIRDQCRAAGIAFFHKQNGGPTPKARGRLLDGVIYDAMPEQATGSVATLAERRRWIAAIEAANASPAASELMSLGVRGRQ